MKKIKNFKKVNIYSPSVHQESNVFGNYIPINIIPNILNEDLDSKTDFLVINKDFEKTETEIETYESIEKFK